jgi:uncharacterized protein (DUF1697 family)
MSTVIALLRGINVGGRNLLAMSDLKHLLGAIGLTSARSLLQSGNLVFDGGGWTGADLERLLEVETEKRLGVSADYIIRNADEWQTVVSRNPFPMEAERDPSHLVVMFFKKALKAKDVKSLQLAVKGPESVRAEGTQLYIVYPAGIGRSKLTNTLIEKQLGSRGTGRNWNTVLKLAALIRE